MLEAAGQERGEGLHAVSEALNEALFLCLKASALVDALLDQVGYKQNTLLFTHCT